MAPAAAQDAARQPITLVVGYPPGGSNDIAARIIAAPLSRWLDVPVAVVNKPGANAAAAAEFVAHSAPDGNTLFVVSAGPLVVSPHARTVSYDTLKDFAGIARLGFSPEVIAAHPALPVKNLREFMELSKTRPLTAGSPGHGGIPHLVIELMKASTPGSRLMHVPYKGSGPAVIDLLGRHIDAAAGDAGSYLAQLRGGTLRALAVTSAERVNFLPQVATAREQGYPELVAESWMGVFAPAKTPRPVIDRLHAALTRIATLARVKDQLAAEGITVMTTATPGGFQEFVAQEYARWGKIARDSGVKPEQQQQQ
jgi:tripartite-type tricarboxylate transporter receptor subunit TctC